MIEFLSTIDWGLLLFSFGITAIPIITIFLSMVYEDYARNKYYRQGYNSIVKSVLNGGVVNGKDRVRSLSEFLYIPNPQLSDHANHINEEYARGYNDGVKYLKKVYKL